MAEQEKPRIIDVSKPKGALEALERMAGEKPLDLEAGRMREVAIATLKTLVRKDATDPIPDPEPAE